VFLSDKPKTRLLRKSSVALGDSGDRKESVLSCYVEANPEPQVFCRYIFDMVRRAYILI
jgi:hypothetical protein